MRCCSTRSTGYWFGFFLLFYGGGLLASELWPALEAFSMPLLLTALDASALVSLSESLVWGLALIGTGVAFLLEHRYAS